MITADFAPAAPAAPAATTTTTTPAPAAAPAAPEARAVAFFVSARRRGDAWTHFVSSPAHPEDWALAEFLYQFRKLGWEKFVEHIEGRMTAAIYAAGEWGCDWGVPPPREIPL